MTVIVTTSCVGEKIETEQVEVIKSITMKLSRYFCCSSSPKQTIILEDAVSPVPTGAAFLLQLPIPRDWNQLLNYEASLKAYLEDTQSKHKALRASVAVALKRQNSFQAKTLIEKGKRYQAQEKALQEKLEQVFLQKERWHVEATSRQNPLLL